MFSAAPAVRVVSPARALWRAPGDSPMVNNFVEVLRTHRQVRAA
jgi:hypothetical protein